MPANYPLDIYRGDTYRWQFRFWQDETKATPSDLTGVVVASELRAKDSKQTLVATLECAVTLPNIVDVLLSAAESAKLTATESAQWDLQLTYADGIVWTAVAGAVRVQIDATH